MGIEETEEDDDGGDDQPGGPPAAHQPHPVGPHHGQRALRRHGHEEPGRRHGGDVNEPDVDPADGGVGVADVKGKEVADPVPQQPGVQKAQVGRGQGPEVDGEGSASAERRDGEDPEGEDVAHRSHGEQEERAVAPHGQRRTVISQSLQRRLLQRVGAAPRHHHHATVAVGSGGEEAAAATAPHAVERNGDRCR